MMKAFAFAFVCFSTLCAAQTPNLAGTYTGMLATHPVQLHITSNADGSIDCTADSADQKMVGLRCANAALHGQALSFEVPAVGGSWTGFVSSGGNALLGTWMQGNPSPLNFMRGNAAAPVVNPTFGAPPPQIATQRSRPASCSMAAFQDVDSVEPSGTAEIDDASRAITVSRPDGVTVRFEDQNTKIICGPLNYTIKPIKGGVSRVFEAGILHPHNNAGSALGGGLQFMMNSGVIYDSGMGIYGDPKTNAKVRSAKKLSKIAVQAVDDVRALPGHQDFTPNGYKTMKEISQYRLE